MGIKYEGIGIVTFPATKNYVCKTMTGILFDKTKQKI